jgi:4-hydroxy-tetrahydrodipicolinate synthase
MFTGAMTALITPLREGRLDEARLRQQIERQIAGGIDALVPVGSTGESPTLDFKEHERVIEISIEASRGRVPVIAGVGANATSEALELHSFAKRAGADAGLSVVPYYNKPSQEGIYRHFMTLADKVDLRIVLYNIPGRSVVNMSPQTVARLARHPNIVAIKESPVSLDQVSEYLSLCDITVISGDDSLTLPMMAIGAKGVISVLSNLVPEQIKRLVALATDGNWSDARALHRKLFPLMRAMFLDGNPAGIKYAMNLIGQDTGELRAPLWEASDAAKSAIKDQMQKAGLL